MILGSTLNFDRFTILYVHLNLQLETNRLIKFFFSLQLQLQRRLRPRRGRAAQLCGAVGGRGRVPHGRIPQEGEGLEGKFILKYAQFIFFVHTRHHNL